MPSAPSNTLRAAAGGAEVCARLMGVRLRAQMQYRWSFIVDVVANFAAMTTEFAAVVVVFRHIPAMDGWTLPEVALLYGSAEVCLATARVWFAGFDIVPDMVRSGDFDRILTRPRSTFVQVLGSDLSLRNLGRAAQGFMVLGLGIVWLSPSWTAAEWLFGAWTLMGGALFFGGLFVAGGTLAFWTVQSLEVMNVFTYGGSTMAGYPMSIYGDRLRRFFTFIVPLAFVNYYPAMHLLGKTDPFGAPPWIAALSFPACAAVLAASVGFWHMGVRHYSSTGS